MYKRKQNEAHVQVSSPGCRAKS